jgi:hypothetical protein
MHTKAGHAVGVLTGLIAGPVLFFMVLKGAEGLTRIEMFDTSPAGFPPASTSGSASAAMMLAGTGRILAGPQPARTRPVAQGHATASQVSPCRPGRTEHLFGLAASGNAPWRPKHAERRQCALRYKWATTSCGRSGLHTAPLAWCLGDGGE